MLQLSLLVPTDTTADSAIALTAALVRTALVFPTDAVAIAATVAAY